MNVDFFNEYRLTRVVDNTMQISSSFEKLPEDLTEYKHLYSVKPKSTSFYETLANYLNDNNVDAFFSFMRQYRSDIAWVINYVEHQGICAISCTNTMPTKEFFIILKEPFYFDPLVIRIGTIHELDIYEVHDNPHF